MNKLKFYLGLVLMVFMLYGPSAKAESQQTFNSFMSTSTSHDESSVNTHVKILTGTPVVKGHGYTGWGAVTVRLKDGKSYVEHYSDIVIDYGLFKKAIRVAGAYYVEYDSECESLETDKDAADYVARRWGGDDVAYILVELAVKQW